MKISKIIKQLEEIKTKHGDLFLSDIGEDCFKKKKSIILKDHEIRELTNELTEAAKKYKGCQSLREGISRIVCKYLKSN